MPIRRLAESDIPTLVEMVYHYRASESHKDVPQTKKMDIDLAFRKIMKKRGSFPMVYIDGDGDPAGYILYHIHDYPIIMGKEAYISDLLVRTDKRGAGIGSALLAHAERHAQRSGCTRLMLNNPKEGASYKRDFYRKHGYTERNNFANFVKVLQ
jgi:GNAT superfamily N-acetyltransferase